MSDDKKDVKNNKNNEAIPSSLRFPSVTLEICLEKVHILFSKNSKNPMTADAMIIDMGYALSGGHVKSILSSMKYYGLLEKESNDQFKIADFVIDYCLQKELNHDILFKALNSVPINKKIFSTYDFNSLPSENVIKSLLIKECNYTLKQATEYLETFKKNKKLYDDNSKGKIELNNTENTFVEISKSETIKSNIEHNDNIIDLIQDVSTTISSHKNAVIKYPIGDNRSVLIQLPGELKELEEQDLEDIKDILELVLKKVNKQLHRNKNND